MNKPHRKLINASLGSSSVRGWLGAVKLTDLKVCYERKADILSGFFCYYLYVAMLYGYIYTKVRISLFPDHN
jgi:hypothetical protein